MHSAGKKTGKNTGQKAEKEMEPEPFSKLEPTPSWTESKGAPALSFCPRKMSSDCGAVAVRTFLLPPGWLGKNHALELGSDWPSARDAVSQDAIERVRRRWARVQQRAKRASQER